MNQGQSPEFMKEMLKKAHGPRSDAAKMRLTFNAVRTYPVPEGVDMDNSPTTYRGDILINFLKSKSGVEIKELLELENLVTLLKGDDRQKIWKKVQKGSKLDNNELAYIRMIKETLVDLHKLKYGEKRLNVNTNFKDLRDILWGKIDVNPPGK